MNFINEFSIVFWSGFETILLGYFIFSSLYVLVFSIAGHFYKENRGTKTNRLNNLAVFVPAYKEDEVILNTVRQMKLQKYPPNFFDIIVIADSLKQSTLDQLQKLKICLVEVSFEESTKVKALKSALSTIQKSYDYAVVLDADNVMESNFLTKMNDAFNRGYRVVQGHRKAKNLNTSYAILDAASEAINNFIFRKGHRALGLSSGLIGSGMGFEFDLFQRLIFENNAVGGFDKELEFQLAKEGIIIEYLQNAVVYDEKIQSGKSFSSQRKRWLSTQFVYLFRNIGSSLKELILKRNINFFDKTIQLLVPPRVLLVGITSIVSIAYVSFEIIFSDSITIVSILWLTNLLMVTTSFIVALPLSFYNQKTLRAVRSIPSAFLRMFILLFQLRGANKRFIHTTHGG